MRPGIIPPSMHCTEENILKYLVLITGCFNVGKLGDVEIYRLTKASFIGLTPQSRALDVADVSKLLSSGNFYFCSPDNSDGFSLCCNAQVHNDSSEEVTDFVWYVCACVPDVSSCISLASPLTLLSFLTLPSHPSLSPHTPHSQEPHHAELPDRLWCGPKGVVPPAHVWVGGAADCVRGCTAGQDRAHLTAEL